MKQWNLIRLRSDRNLKQKDVARLINISEESYGMKERGQTQFQMEEMFILSGYFGLAMEQIFLPRDFGNTEVELRDFDSNAIKVGKE